MTTQSDDIECNRIIAEFMGDDRIICPSCRYGGYDYKDLYTRSLDALVPVWIKLNIVPEFFSNWLDWHEVECYIEHNKLYFNSEKPTYQQAAAHATAKAIQELK